MTNHKPAQEAARDKAVALVDQLCGYTKEFAASPSHHEYLYRLVTAELTALLTTREAELRAEVERLEKDRSLLIYERDEEHRLHGEAEAALAEAQKRVERLEKAQKLLVQICRHFPQRLHMMPSILEARELLRTLAPENEEPKALGICKHGNSVPDPDCGCGV